MANNNNNNRRPQDAWTSVLAGVLGVGAAAAGIYYTTKNSSNKQEPSQSRYEQQSSSSDSSQGTSYFSDLIDRASQSSHNGDSFVKESSRGRIRDKPRQSEITNINSLLHDIYLRYVALKQNEFEYYYNIFFKIFYSLHQKMKDVDPYYKRYSSMVQFAGSHYDSLRIKKPDEFDMDVVIGLPLNMRTDPFHQNESDIIIEPKDPGYVYLNMGVQYNKLPERDLQDWPINSTAYKWKDDNSKCLLRSKFTDWFKSVVAKALNKFDANCYSLPIYKVDGVVYTIRRSESGPAVTLIIENVSENFKLDVDLVPALRFPESRWPVSDDYREIPHNCKREFWMVVPKPNKSECINDRSRSWRIALHYQERDLMHNSFNLRQAIRLIKKFRDVQCMDKIASYYIKTLFYWEILERNDPKFWTKCEAVILKVMLAKFHDAMVKGRIPYLWNEDNNLIEGVKRSTLDLYATKIKKFMDELDLIDILPRAYKNAAKHLLTKDEFKEYNDKYLQLI